MNVLVILVALGEQQRSWYFIFLREMRKLLTKKCMYICMNIYKTVFQWLQKKIEIKELIKGNQAMRFQLIVFYHRTEFRILDYIYPQMMSLV